MKNSKAWKQTLTYKTSVLNKTPLNPRIATYEQNNHTTQCTKQIPIKYLKACRSLHNTLSFYLYMHVKYCALEQDRTCVQSSSTWNGFRMGQLPIQRPTLSQTNSSWEMLYIIHVAIYHGRVDDHIN